RPGLRRRLRDRGARGLPRPGDGAARDPEQQVHPARHPHLHLRPDADGQRAGPVVLTSEISNLKSEIRMPLYRSQSSQRRIPPPEPVSLSREILERIERVREYHQASKHTYEQVQTAQQTALLDWDNKPSAYRTFADHPRTPLPT